MPQKNGRWGWVIVVACFVVSMIYDGMTYSYGIIFVEILEAFKESRSFTAGIGGLMYGMSILAPLAGWFTNKYGCRVCMMLGGLMSAVGYIISAWSTGVVFLYCSIGIIAGLGSILFYPISKWLIDTFGWRGAVLLEGGLALNCTALALLFKPVRSRTGERSELSGKENIVEEMELIHRNGNDNIAREDDQKSKTLPQTSLTMKKKKYFKWSLLKQPLFIIYLIGGLCNGLSFAVPFAFIPDMSISKGYTKSQAVLLMTTISIANTVTRLPCGVVMDSRHLNRTLMYALCTILMGVSVATMPFTSQYKVLLAVCAMFGVFCASTTVLGPLVSADLFGAELIAESRGFLNVVYGLGNLISGPITGVLFDLMGNYRASFLLCGSTFAIEGLIRMYLFILSRKRGLLIG